MAKEQQTVDAQEMANRLSTTAHAHPCPNCGHCPTCGRSNARPWGAYPWWLGYPYPATPVYPQVTWGGTAAQPIPAGGTYTFIDTTSGNYA